jgi:hypothetical protein
MPVALPKLPEQQKIADCLTSLDDLPYMLKQYSPASAINVYMIRLTTPSMPPNRVAIMSNLNKPISPQLMAPIITRVNAV